MSGQSPHRGPWSQPSNEPQQGYPHLLGGSERQWAARVRIMIRSGTTGEEILRQMGQHGWAFESAVQLLKQIASKERSAAIWIMLSFGLIGLIALAGTITAIVTGNGELSFGMIPGMILGFCGGGYGLVRLTKMRV